MVQDQVQGDSVSAAAVGARTIGRDARVKLTSESVARGASLLLTVLAARRLGEDGFGIYSHALAVGVVIAQLGDVGLQLSCAREVAANGRGASAFVTAAFRVKCFLSAAVV